MEPQTQITLAGVVRTNAGRPMGGITLKAYRRSGDDLVTIGSAVTDAEGRFTLAIAPIDGANAGKPVFRLYDEAGKALDVVEQKGPKRQGENRWQIAFMVAPADEAPSFVVRGHVTLTDGSPMDGVLVRAFDRDGNEETLLGADATDDQGRYRIPYTIDQIDVPGKSHADLVVRVYTPNQDLLVASELVPQAPADCVIDLVAPFDVDADPDGDEPYRVFGRILHMEGAAVPDVRVQAVAKRLRGETELGVAQTGTEGGYQIRYRPPTQGSIDLLVRVFAGDADEPLAASKLICNARRVEEVNLEVEDDAYRGPSEFERYHDRIQPFLEGEKLDSLGAGEVQYLACTTGIEDLHIAYLVVASRYGMHIDLPEAVFYGLFRRGAPTSLAQLLRKEPRFLVRALEKATAANIIASQFASQSDQLVAKLRDYTVAVALAPSEVEGVFSLGDLLQTTPLSQEQQRALLQDSLQHTGAPETFWDDARADLGDDVVDDVQFMLRLGALTQNHLPLVHYLQGQQQNGDITSIQDLARLDTSDWQQILASGANGQVIGTPSWIPGETEEERRQRYAETLARTLESAFPTSVLAGEIVRAGDPLQVDLGHFLTSNPTFEVRETNIAQYLEENEDVLEDVEDRIALIADLARWQRVSRLVPGTNLYDTITPLLDDGLDSAQRILQLGRQPFLKTYAEALGGADVATQIYDRAGHTAAAALSLYARYSPNVNQASPWVLNTPSLEEAPVTGDWETLFGSLAYCACEHCRSIYSPAAYLVDLLQFLGQEVSSVVLSPTGRPLLLSPRQVLLARRPDIGEIALSCENTNTLMPYIDLAIEVFENAVTGETAAYQTTWQEEELAANTEHINHAAYDNDHLAGQLYPFSMPFHLWIEEARVYLAHLGITLDELLDVFHHPMQDSSGVNASKLTLQEATEYLGLTPLARKIITKDVAAPLRRFWGTAESGWKTELQQVPAFLSRTELSYEGLLELLSTDFINPLRGSITITLPDIPLPDIPGNGLPEDPTPPGHGLPSHGNEIIIDLPGLGVVLSEACSLKGAWLENLTDEALDKIHRFLRLQRTLGWEIRDLDRALQALDADDLTEVVLLRIATVKRLLDALNVPLLEMLSWWHNIDTRIYEQDESRLSVYEQVFLDPTILNPVDEAFALNEDRDELATIGLISEHVPAIAAALQISAEELALLTASEVSGDTLDLAGLSHLYRIVSFARALGLSLTEFLSVKALTGLDPFDVTQISQTLRFVSATEFIEQSAFSIADLDYLLRHESGDGTGMALSEEDILLGLDRLTTELQRAASDAEREAIIVGYVASTFGLDNAMANALLTEHLPDALSAFLAIDVEAEPLEYSAPVIRQYTLLHKVTAILDRLDATVANLPPLFGDPRDYGWLAFDQLPAEAGQVAAVPELLQGWQRLVRLFALRDRYAAEDGAFVEIIDAAYEGVSEPEVWTLIVAATGWNEDDLAELVGAEGLNLAYPDDYKNEHYLIRLDEAFTMLGQIGLSAAEVLAWTPADDTGKMQAAAHSIKQAVKTRYDEAAWLSVAAPLKDTLREKQRVALVSYLAATMGEIDTPSDLFEHFLIDGEMTACMKTSRIKQAISSVQLFTQRCLMGLEPNAPLSEAVASQWTWMKNYRVWEAARKLFAYPESYVEPDLRDLVSPLFENLAGELLQQELTDASAREALVHYLEQLDEISHLEVCGMFHQVETTDEDEAIDILHVVAHTLNEPRSYYYRQWVADAYWTPWEKINLEISYPYAIPVVFMGTLYLFTPAVDEDTDQGGWLITLQWSTYRSRSWTPLQRSENALYLQDPGRPVQEGFFFEVTFDDDELVLVVLAQGTNFSYDNYAWVSPDASSFHLSGCSQRVTAIEDDLFWRFYFPPGTQVEYMSYVEREGDSWPLVLTDGEMTQNLEDSPLATTEITLLEKTPSIFKLASPHQLGFFASKNEFFYHDKKRVFFVRPVAGYRIEAGTELPASPNYVAEYYPYAGTVYRGDGTAAPPVPAGLEVDRNAAVSSLSVSVSSAPAMAQTGSQARSISVEQILNDASTGHVFYDSTTPLARVVTRHRFESFFHPYVCSFTQHVNQGGADALLRRSTQSVSKNYFEDRHEPTEDVDPNYPADEVDFSAGGAYALYNEELFFHAPLLIAERLRLNQRFEEAMQWYHFIFNPMSGADDSGAGPEQFWIYSPFYQEAAGDTTWEMMLDLAAGDRAMTEQVEQWRKDPFQPHTLARLRPQAYQKSVVIKYVHNLIGWGDQLFARDTIESINEAAQLYILAANVLGDRPELLPARDAEVQTYNSLKDDLDAFSNALVELENYVGAVEAGPSTGIEQLPLTTLYFCVPPNDQLLELWDTVADRLFKVRNCMNLDGVVRQLPLWEPPIDPDLLVQAAAAGVDIGEVLSDLYAPLPPYRFQVMQQKAIALCSEVRALGAALLSALEKQDAEALAFLRAGQEVDLLTATRQVKEQQVDEAWETWQAVERSRDAATAREIYYAGLIENGLSEYEEKQQARMREANAAQMTSNILHIAASSGFVAAAVAKSGFLKVGDAAEFAAKATEATAQAASAIATYFTFRASMNALGGGHERREEEWAHQLDLARKEKAQLDRQIVAAEIRHAIAENDLENFDRQIENAREVYDFVRDKYTNEALYGWMASQISSTYFLSYQLAYDLARRAQQAYAYELAVSEPGFIQYGYWDNLKKGLLAGEKLQYDLQRMDASYLDLNTRQYELTKHVSLAMLDPVALLMLKETGTCYITLPEPLFDLDYPGHYLRRIKSISLTIPAVTGPYTSVNATLTLLGNSTRTSSDPTGIEGNYTRDVNGDDLRFNDSYGAIQSIATSHAQHDAGLFELIFRDERYLPFEGAGVISQWRLELPTTFKSFDYDTISDVILHVHYTAKDGGDALKTAADSALKTAINALPLGANGDERAGLFQTFSAQRDFPSEWHRFLYSSETDGTQTLALDLGQDRFPYFVSEQEIAIEAVHLFLKPTSYAESENYALAFSLAGTDGTHAGTFDVGSSPISGLPYSEPIQGAADSLGMWTFEVAADGTGPAWRDADGLLDATAIEDLILVCAYSISD